MFFAGVYIFDRSLRVMCDYNSSVIITRGKEWKDKAFFFGNMYYIYIITFLLLRFEGLRAHVIVHCIQLLRGAKHTYEGIDRCDSIC